MNKHQVLAVIILVVLISTVPLVQAAETLTKPTATLPAHWTLKSQTPYPDEQAEHDPAGAGVVVYYNSENNDNVQIYYEKVQSTFNNATLQAEAETLFQRDLSDTYTAQESGTITVSGVAAGYVRGVNAANTVFGFYAVLVKGNYYIDIIALYDANTQSVQDVTTVIDSISTGGSSPLGGSMLFLIIGIIAAIIVVVVIVVVMMSRKKKKAQQQQQPQQMMPGAYPPPPPPPA